MGNGLLSTLAAVRLADSGVSEAGGGWILACYFLGLALGTLVLGPTIARIGGARAFAASAGVGISAALAHGLLEPGPSWAILRIFSGLAMAGLYMTVESWLNAEATLENRGRVMAAYLVALYLGIAAGQLVLPNWPKLGMEAFAFAALAIALAAVVAATSRAEAPQLQAAERISVRALLNIAPLGWVGAWISGMLAGSIYASVPLSARSLGLSASDVSFLMLAYVVGGLAGQWPIGRLSDKMDRRAVLLGVAALLSVCCFATPLVDPMWTVGRSAVAFMTGALAFSIYPIAVAHTLDRVGAHDSLGAASQMLLSSSIGAVLGPIVASTASDSFGPSAPHQVNGVLLSTFAFIAATRMVLVRRVAQEPFVFVPRTTTAIHELDPRIEDSPLDSDFVARPR
jgi:MFS family permease